MVTTAATELVPPPPPFTFSKQAPKRTISDYAIGRLEPLITPGVVPTEAANTEGEPIFSPIPTPRAHKRVSEVPAETEENEGDQNDEGDGCDGIEDEVTATLTTTEWSRPPMPQKRSSCCTGSWSTYGSSTTEECENATSMVVNPAGLKTNFSRI